ncbi:DNA-directed RNA polymerase II subunit RPB1-like [Gigantopelta aegis]|uniref:DNA-directed RNA polymerase II subunit RPB1-like n=1 Tax=Gigantopelta aegis TaxID=1735272 RepID=UPI001B88D883|nr:DNA-directed RNA polymerase II subunit RPB1-like [Gigantopelta aegis]
MNYQNVGGMPSTGILVADKNSMYPTPPGGFPPTGLYQQSPQQQPSMPTAPGSRIQHAAAFSSGTQAYASPFYTPTTGYSSLSSPYQLTATTGAYPGMSYQPVSTSPSYPPGQYTTPAAYFATQAPSSGLGPTSTLGPTSAQYASAMQGAGSQVVYPTGSISAPGYGAYHCVPAGPGYQMSSIGYPASLGNTPSFPPGASLYGPRF